MRLRSVRFTLWQLMAVIAVVAMNLGAIELTRRRQRFLEFAAYHRSQVTAPVRHVDWGRRVVLWVDRRGRMLADRPRLDCWHEELSHTYQAAASSSRPRMIRSRDTARL